MTGPASTTGRTRRRSFASSGITYEAVAGRLGVQLCPGSWDCGYDDPSHDHERGFATYHPPTVHWRPRQMYRRGLRRFLIHVARLKRGGYPQEPIAVQVYHLNRLAQDMASYLGLRLPRELSARDRAAVRLALPRTKIEPPALRRRVYEWAKQQPKPVANE